MYDEFNQYVEKARKGDLESIGEILERLRPLIIAQIKRYYNKRDEYEDLLSQGNIVIMEALKNFDENRGVKFLGYVKCQLKYKYLDGHKKRHHISLNSPISNEGEGEMIDRLVSEDDGPLDLFLNAEKYEDLYRALDRLTIRQREVVTMYYVNRKSIAEISDILGIAYRTTVNTKTNALSKMEEFLSR